MTCAEARSSAVEYALGVLDPALGDAFERHLRWCAACRREAAGFGSAATTLAFATAPAAPAPSLEDAVVDAVREAAGVRRRGAGRRGRLALALALTGLLAVSGLGWGAVMAGRAARSDEQAEAAERAMQRALDRFRSVLVSPELSGSAGEASLAHLSPDPDGEITGATGEAVIVASGLRGALVTVEGLPADEERFPYVVRLGGPGKEPLVVGKIRKLAGDGAVVSRIFDVALTGYSSVVVRDRDRRVILRGVLDAHAPLFPRR